MCWKRMNTTGSKGARDGGGRCEGNLLPGVQRSVLTPYHVASTEVQQRTNQTVPVPKERML